MKLQILLQSYFHYPNSCVPIKCVQISEFTLVSKINDKTQIVQKYYTIDICFTLCSVLPVVSGGHAVKHFIAYIIL